MSTEGSTKASADPFLPEICGVGSKPGGRLKPLTRLAWFWWFHVGFSGEVHPDSLRYDGQDRRRRHRDMWVTRVFHVVWITWSVQDLQWSLFNSYGFSSHLTLKRPEQDWTCWNCAPTTVADRSGNARKQGNEKKEIQFFLSKTYCQWVWHFYRVTNFLPKLMDMLLFSAGKT